MLVRLKKLGVDGAFDEHDVAALAAAFDAAWQAVQASGARFGSKADENETREYLAFRVIETARRGERDPLRLRDDALLHLAKSTSQELRPLILALVSPAG